MTGAGPLPPGEMRFVTTDGVAFVYDDIGPRDGVPMVICHGLAAAGLQMEADAAWFADRGYRVLVPDLRGHGRSGKPATMSVAAFAIERMAGDLVEMLEHAAVGPVHWVGNSLGGILALHLLRHDEARLRSLSTYGTAYSLNLPRWFSGVFPLTHRLFGPGINARVTAWSTTRDRAARRLIEQLILDFDPQVGGLVTANLVRYDLIEAGRGASLPILLVRCGRDVSLNSALGPTLAAMSGKPNFTLVELSEAGHCANLDATDKLRAILADFVAAH